MVGLVYIEDTTDVRCHNIDAVRSNFNIYEPEYRWSLKIKGGREGSCHMLLLLLPLPIFHHSLGHHHEQPHHFNTVQQQQLCVGTSHVTSKLFPAAARGGVYNCWTRSHMLEIISGQWQGHRENSTHYSAGESTLLLLILTLGAYLAAVNSSHIVLPVTCICLVYQSC